MENKTNLTGGDSISAQLMENEKLEVSISNEKIEKKQQLISLAEQSLNEMSVNIFGFVGIHSKSIWRQIIAPLILIVVAIAEMPLNATAFEIFGRGQTETLVIAGLFGVVIAISAHFAGHYIQRYRATKNISNMIVGILVFVMALIGLYVSSILRVKYLTIMNSSETMLTSQGNMFFMSMFIFCAGVFSSYYFTSSAPNLNEENAYYQGVKDLKKAKKEIRTLEKSKETLQKFTQKRIQDIQNKNKYSESQKESLRKANELTVKMNQISSSVAKKPEETN